MKRIEDIEELLRVLDNQYWIAVDHQHDREIISVDILKHAPIIYLVRALHEGRLYACPN